MCSHVTLIKASQIPDLLLNGQPSAIVQSEDRGTQQLRHVLTSTSTLFTAMPKPESTLTIRQRLLALPKLVTMLQSNLSDLYPQTRILCSVAAKHCTSKAHIEATMSTMSTQLWRNAVLLITALAFAGLVGATTGDASSCAAVLCPENSTCENGKCKLICPAGYKNCNGRFDDGCEANVRDGDIENCGNCGAKCRPPKSYEFVNCVDGKCKYTDRCTAIKCATYPNSSTTCSKAQCRVTCNPGYGNCNGVLEVGKDGCEVNLLSDVNNCGKCGRKCFKTRSYLKPKCRNGVCG